MIPIMWATWGLLVVLTVAVYLYRSSLTRDEEDQIFLSDGFEHEKVVQSAITAKVNKIQPVVTVCSSLVAVASLFVLGYYVFDAVQRFK
jgi:divalent metal cation (Fe/Co/Zn/Cd) transporter